MGSNKMSTVYDIVTDRIKSQLEAGVVPWTKPFVSKNLGQQKKPCIIKKVYWNKCVDIINVWYGVGLLVITKAS